MTIRPVLALILAMLVTLAPAAWAQDEHDHHEEEEDTHGTEHDEHGKEDEHEARGLVRLSEEELIEFGIKVEAAAPGAGVIDRSTTHHTRSCVRAYDRSTREQRPCSSNPRNR